MASESQPTKGRRRAAKAVETAAAEEVSVASDKAIVSKGRATPGRRAQETEHEGPRGPVGRVIDYIAGVRSELDKVSWPSRAQAILLLRVVLIVTVVAAILLGIVSLAFNELFAAGLENPLIFLIFGVVVGAVTFWVLRRRSTTTVSVRR